jgi:hypothetical protein
MMTHHRRIALCCLLLAATAVTAAARGDEAPAWLTRAASAQTPAYPKDVPGVVLHDESQMTVAQDGRVTTVTTYAVRVLTREGRALAQAAVPYATDTGRVREFRAWLIRPGGQVKAYGKDETLDLAAADNDVYNEARIKKISAAGEADAGAVFGYQWTTEERALFPQADWWFQSGLPVLSSRLTLALPAGWTASGHVFNHADKINPVVTGSTYTWEMRNLPPIEREVAGPGIRSLAPWLAVSYAPPANSPATVMGARGFSSWSDVSRWYTELSDATSKPDEAVAAKARELTANARTELDKIRAIGRYVQELQYISIQIGVGRYRPHTAAEVFAKRYGDCKDKANLMRAMLKVIGIEAYPVLIYSGDPTYVRAEWASPTQFNHCIIAIKVGAETQAATVVEHPGLGRLLIFDATDDDTPVGDLPDHEQNSLALVAAGEAGALIRMPATPPEANRLERTAEVTLQPDGSITAALREHSTGQAAVEERRIFRKLARPEYQQAIQEWITRGATGARVTKVEPADDHAAGRFSLGVDFSAGAYGQLMQQRLLVFKPAVVSRRDFLAFTNRERKHPVVLDASAYTETVKIKLPEGFDVDELPDPVKLDAPFGSYSTTYEVKDGQLHFRRAFQTRATTIPPDNYPQVRSFFERIRAAEQSPVVLAKK